MADCKCEFVYDELHGCVRCKKCFRVLTAEEKRELLEHANAMRRAEEDEGNGLLADICTETWEL